jgi:hypothetical protein
MALLWDARRLKNVIKIIFSSLPNFLTSLIWNVLFRTVYMASTHGNDVCHRVHRVINSYNVTSFRLRIRNWGYNIAQVLDVNCWDDVFSSSYDVESFCVAMPRNLAGRNFISWLHDENIAQKWNWNYLIKEFSDLIKKSIYLEKVMEDVFFAPVRKPSSYHIGQKPCFVLKRRYFTK